jgi:hypothetical protein
VEYTLLRKLVWMACLWLIVAPSGWAKGKYTTGFIQVLPDAGCVLDQKAIRCDRVPSRLRAMHLSPGFSVLVAVDDAPYETVVTLLDSLRQNGIRDIVVMPPFQGTIPSKSIKHWIKFAVEGEINHPFQTAMISTERFKTWREKFILLPPSDFTIVDDLAKARIEKGDCVKNVSDLSLDLRQKEHRLLLFEHSDDGTRSCLLPRAATSCEFLSEVSSLRDVRWGNEDLDAVRSVAGEIGCNVQK